MKISIEEIPLKFAMDFFTPSWESKVMTFLILQLRPLPLVLPLDVGHTFTCQSFSFNNSGRMIQIQLR